MFGKLLALPIRLANIPFRALEKIVDSDSKRDDEDNIISKPLEKLAQAIEEVDN